MEQQDKYPEHNKLSKVKEQSQWLGEFLDWAANEGYNLMYWQEGDLRNIGEYCHVKKSINTLLSEYYQIDLIKLEEEKEQMLNEIRELNKEK